MDRLKLFVKFATKQLGIKKMPNIHYVGHEEDSKMAFGHNTDDDIYVRIIDRHPLDIMRTLAHELVHYATKNKGGSDKQREDEANAKAGRIMRDFDTKHPEIFKDKANVSEEEVAANHMGTSSSTAGTGGIDTVDPLLKRFKTPLKRNMPFSPARKLRDIIGREYKNEKRADKR